MARFQFEAKDRGGTVYRDQIEATDARHAHQILGARNLFVIRLHEEGSAREAKAAAPVRRERVKDRVSELPISRAWQNRSRRKAVGPKTEQLCQLLRAGMRLSEVLGVMARRSSDPGWQVVFDDLRLGVVSGKSLSDSMASHPELFGSLYRAMVGAGEASGHLIEVLERLAIYLQKRDALQQKVMGALLLPAITVLGGIGTVIFFMVVMLPKISGMFKDMGQTLPLPTQILVWISEWLIRFGWTLPILFAVFWMLARAWLKVPSNRLNWDDRRLRLPIVGRLLLLSETSRFTQTLATLLGGGITLVEALQVAESTFDNTALKVGVHSARMQVRDGKTLNESLSGQNLFPELMLDMLAVGERTGDLAGSLKHTADSYERDLDRAVQTFTALMGPALTILMALFVGAIVLSVLLAVMDLTSGITKTGS